MAAPTYAKDLTLLDDCADSTGWAEPTEVGWTSLNAVTSGETDAYIEGTKCNSSTIKVGVGGYLFDAGAAGVTIPTDGAFFQWLYFSAPNCLAPFGTAPFDATEGGIRLVIGSALDAFNAWVVEGSDTYQYGGWINRCCNPTVTADYNTGTVTTLRYFGYCYNAPTAVPSKGNTFYIDACYYGRGEARFSTGEDGDPATFTGFAAANDASTARWGLISACPGGYNWKGLMTLGYTNPVYFEDSNTQILIEDTKKVTSGFNKIEIRQATSTVLWTSISFLALGTVSKGALEVIDDATVAIDKCTFTAMNTFIFQSNSTVTSTVFRRCAQVTQGSATFTNCSFENSTATTSLLSNNPTAVTGCTFVSDGGNHAIELTAACAGNSYNLTNHTFTNYAGSDGDSGNEVIYNKSGGYVILTASGCTGTISVRNDGISTTLIESGSVNITVTVKTVGGTAIENARVLLLAADAGPFPYDDTVTITRSGTTATVTHASHGMATNDKVSISGAVQQEYNGIFTITWLSANSYSYQVTGAPTSPASGIIKCTFVPLYGLSNGSGVVTTSRKYTSSQPITGRVRKSSTIPYYKTSDIIDTISSTSGYSATIPLLTD